MKHVRRWQPHTWPYPGRLSAARCRIWGFQGWHSGSCRTAVRVCFLIFHLFVYFRLNRVFVATQALFLLHHWGLLASLVRRLPVAVASLFVAAQARGVRASVAALPGLKGTGSAVVGLGLSCSLAGGIFPNQGSNLCLPHQQADSFPLSHQGSRFK